ncbi:MAG: acyl-CoA dehydrogenase family protein [Rhodospirillales bacterium]|nr:acyl-CoA dehydrogenase family protein [Rhodospirillales bacterium]
MANSEETRREMIARARALTPKLLDRARDAEEARRIPEQTHLDFLESGLYRVFQPARYGGNEFDLGMMIELAGELGRGCGSSAWIFSNLSVQNWMIGMTHPQAQEEVWGDNPEALTASSFPSPGATVKRVDGGIVVDGVWSFASGVDWADWNHMQIIIPNESGPPEFRFALVHKSDYEVIDDWFVTGLAATGSRSIRVNELFIPDHRTLMPVLIRDGNTPGSAVNPNPLYRHTFWAIGSKVFAGPVIGMAQGALDTITNNIAGRVSVGGVNLADQGSVHLRIAESGAEIAAARALSLSDCAQAYRMAETGELPSMEQRAGWRRNDAYAVMSCVRAVERLYALAGGRGIAWDNPYQRAWRDIHAGSSQIVVAWDLHATTYGKVKFGLPSPDPRL